MTAIDIPPIEIALLDRIPKTTQQLANCIASRLSKKPKTAGLGYVSHNPKRELLQEDEEIYNLGQQYGGAARLKVKPYGDKGPSTTRLGSQDVQTNKSQRLSLFWMTGIMWYFACR